MNKITTKAVLPVVLGLGGLAGGCASPVDQAIDEVADRAEEHAEKTESRATIDGDSQAHREQMRERAKDAKE